ncbi:uncharacterized protein A1O9_00124 [Exophiala aquamarina CBS 119918]|uniref:Peptidase metallopeptidase domain-containing protein n=1 Tax=Exophiala aquamarina CBS 119918 TaxID=1182545 RepID=A0A072PQX4_9EURO|nr:uncharacterized protein A1O9_00124 [Exophiala aquamarina CBS 119918]KEF62152.1 hypothetical protein A1O9_00124 [Exophiala aquamarina CBS 119918]
MASVSFKNKVRFDHHSICKLPYNLEIGATHKGVLEVKRYLKHFDYAESKSFKVDSTFDDATRTALRRFQSWFTLDETGLFDGPTKAALTAARCAHSRANPLAANTISKWNKKNLTYAYGPLSKDLPANVCKAAVRRAFDTWQNAGVGLRFIEASAGATPDISIDWRDALDADLLALDPDGNGMVGGTLAHADFPGSGSIIVENGTPPLPLHFDDEEHIWVDGAVPNAFDIETVALHEIGHTLGLLHSDDPNAIMAPTVADNVTKRRLGRDDLVGIRRLYGSA